MNINDFFPPWRSQEKKGIQEGGEMGSRNNKLISITKTHDIGGLPQFILLSHRHLIKGKHTASHIEGSKRSYMVPIDILALVLPAEMVTEIESLELGYEK